MSTRKEAQERIYTGDDLGASLGIPVEEEVVDDQPRSTERALLAELQALRAELNALKSRQQTGSFTQGEGVGGYPWMYWRRPKREGDPMSEWITIGPGGATPRGARDVGTYNLYLKKGFKPITQYGYVKPPESERGWLDFVALIERGGAKEFPVSQILAYRWHLRPPVPGVTFPQLEKIKDEIQHAVCPQCDFDIWAPPDDMSIGNRLFEHLWSTHGFEPERAEEFCHRQGFLYVRQQITDELTVERNKRAAAKLLNQRKALGRV